MTQATDPFQQVISYIRHQAAKGLDHLDSLIERTATDWSRCLQGTSDRQAVFKPVSDASAREGGSASGGEGPGTEWSVKEVLGHAISASRGVNRQIREALAGRSVERPFGDEASLRAQAAVDERRSMDELRRDVAALFDETRHLITSLHGSDALDRTFHHPFFGPLTLKEWIAFQRVHAMDHIRQIEKIRADPGYPSR